MINAATFKNSRLRGGFVIVGVYLVASDYADAARAVIGKLVRPTRNVQIVVQ